MTSAITRPVSQSASGATSASSSATLRRLRTLERLYEQGYQNVVVDLTMRKLLERQVQEDREQLDELRAELAGFERSLAYPPPSSMPNTRPGKWATAPMSSNGKPSIRWRTAWRPTLNS